MNHFFYDCSNYETSYIHKIQNVYSHRREIPRAAVIIMTLSMLVLIFEAPPTFGAGVLVPVVAAPEVVAVLAVVAVLVAAVLEPPLRRVVKSSLSPEEAPGIERPAAVQPSSYPDIMEKREEKEMRTANFESIWNLHMHTVNSSISITLLVIGHISVDNTLGAALQSIGERGAT
jgi:hypothetical protein